MTIVVRKGFWLAVWLCGGLLLCGSARAQAPTTGPASAQPHSAPANAPPPPPLVAKSPVDFFRELLALNAAERKQLLAARPPEIRKRILAKVGEYESLPPDERELRLRATELRWFLWPLMQMPATNRLEQLAMVPEQDRKLVEDRLREWDKLSADMQKELLDNEAAVRIMTAPEDQKGKLTENLSPAQRETLQAGILKWQALSEEQRQKIMRRFNRFFDLTTEEKHKALSTLSEPERQQIEKTLRAFGNLTAAQRASCIRSFDKFASLSLADRQQFLKNAESWKLMSPGQRQAWRELVHKIPQMPPFPPGFDFPPLPPQPMPSGLPRGIHSVASTNGN